MPVEKISLKEYQKNLPDYTEKIKIGNIIFSIIDNEKEVFQIHPSIKSGSENYKFSGENEECCDVDFREENIEDLDPELVKRIEESRKLPDSAFGSIFDEYKHLLDA